MTGAFFLTIDDLATEAQVGKTKAKELVNSGEVKSVKIGRSRRIRRPDFEEWAMNLPASLPGESEDEAA